MRNANRIWRNALILSSLCAVLTAGIYTRQTSAYARQASGQQARSGEWIINPTREGNQYFLTLNYRTEGRGNNMISGPIEPNRLQGLSGAQIMSAGSHVQFQIVRDAGTFNCEGWFKDGKGSGHFVFSASSAFSAELQKRGISAPNEAQQLSLAMHDVSLVFIDELSAQGYDRPSIDQLVRMGQHGVSLEYVTEMKGLGYTVKSVDLLTRMVDHVNPSVIRSWMLWGSSFCRDGHKDGRSRRHAELHKRAYGRRLHRAFARAINQNCRSRGQCKVYQGDGITRLRASTHRAACENAGPRSQRGVYQWTQGAWSPESTDRATGSHAGPWSLAGIYQEDALAWVHR